MKAISYLLLNVIVATKHLPKYFIECIYYFTGFLPSCKPTFGWTKFLEFRSSLDSDWRRRFQWILSVYISIKLCKQLGAWAEGEKEKEENSKESEFCQPKLHPLWYKIFLFNSIENEECNSEGKIRFPKCLQSFVEILWK